MFGNSGGFGSNKSVFGSPANTGFGFGSNSNTSTPFGASTSSPFATNNNTTSSPFGGGGSGFGTTTTSGFGTTNTNPASGFGTTNNTTSGFSFNNAAATTGGGMPNLPGAGTGNVQYVRTKAGMEERDRSREYISITALPQFQGNNEKTIEELRFLDYGLAAGGTAPTGGSNMFSNNAPASGSLFGSSTTNTGFGSTSATTTGGMFGSSGNTNAFGTTTTNTSGGLFGNTSTPSAFGNNKSSFGNNANAFGSTAASGGLFGNTSANTNTTGGLFGAKPASSFGSNTGFGTSNSNGGGMFGNNTQTNTSSGGLFGSTNNTSTFGNNSTTTTGMFGNTNNNASSGGLFGNKTQQSGSLFGGNNTNTSSGGLFGNTNNNSSNSGGLFGSNNNNTTTGGLFGNTNTNTSGSGGLFGNTNNSTGNLFASNNTNSNSGGLFGGNNSSSMFGNNNTSNNNNSSGGLFGNSNAGNNNMFNNNQNNNGNIQLMNLVNLAGYAKSSNLEMKRHLELAKRAWDPLNNLSSSTQYGPKKFKFQVSLPNSSKTETDPGLLKQKYDSIDPKKSKVNNVESLGALVVRSAQKKRREVVRNNSSSYASKLKLIASPTILRLNNGLKIDKTRRLTTGKQIRQLNIEKESKETDEIPLPPQKLLFAVSTTNKSESVKPENGLAPKLSAGLVQKGYRTKPDIGVLKNKSNQELEAVEDFEIIRVNYGSVKFIGKTDLKGLIISEDMIEINEDSVELYKTEEATPAVGTKLNKPAEITIQNVVIPIGFHGGVVEFTKFLKEVYTPKMDATFLSFNVTDLHSAEKKGIWRFQVEHFTKYGFNQADVKELNEQPTKKVRISNFISKSSLRASKVLTDNFWKEEECYKIVLESFALCRKYEEESLDTKSIEQVTVLLKGLRNLVIDSKNECLLQWAMVFDLLDNVYTKTFELLKQSGHMPTMELIQAVIVQERLESLLFWYSTWKSVINSSGVDAFFEEYKKNPTSIQNRLSALPKNTFCIEVLNLIVNNVNGSLADLEKYWCSSECSNILLYQVCFCFDELKTIGTSSGSKNSLVSSIVSDMVVSRNLLSEKLQIEAFFASLYLCCNHELSKYQSRAVFKNFLLDLPILLSNDPNEVYISEIRKIAISLSLENELVCLVSLIENKTDYLKFDTSEELTYILNKAIVADNFIVLQTVLKKALKVVVFDERKGVCKAVVNALATAYDKGFNFSNVEYTEIVQIQEIYVHIKSAVFDVYECLEELTQNKIKLEFLQQLYILFNEMFLRIANFKSVEGKIGESFVSCIENDCRKKFQRFFLIFETLHKTLKQDDLNFVQEMEKLKEKKFQSIFTV